MNLVAGEIVEVYVENGTTMARIRLRRAYLRVPLTLVAGARIGDSVLVESGIAIAKIENNIAEEK